MKLKNMWKRFWTLDVHNHEGFTLVELIIVIAILAILSTGAIAGYSAYVEKANKTADEALIAEIQHVLLMAYYSDNGTFKGTALLSISADGEASAFGDEFTTTALENAYGENWDKMLKLKHPGWKSKNYDGSNFQGKETYLLGKVDYLTQSLMEPINAFVGDNFEKYMASNGINSEDEQTVSNAAVLYVANNTANLTKEQQKEVSDIFAGAMTSGGSKNVLASVTEVFDGDMVSAAAAMYAIAEAYSMKTGFEFDLEFTENETPETAGAKINNAFMELARKDQNKMKDYLENGSVEQDLAAYFDILDTVNTAKGQVIGNLDKLGTQGGPTWESKYGSIFTSYSNGGVFVFLELDENGMPVTGTTIVVE